ncbi:MAG: hypothetical protein ACOVSI_04135 [Gemmatimonas sp.]
MFRGDGTSLWVYLPSSAPEQVRKLLADTDGTIVADSLGRLLEMPSKAFTIRSSVSLNTAGIAHSAALPDSIPRQRVALRIGRGERV